jgi:hypothetical protein
VVVVTLVMTELWRFQSRSMVCYTAAARLVVLPNQHLQVQGNHCRAACCNLAIKAASYWPVDPLELEGRL